MPSWLPSVVSLVDFGGDPETYLNHLNKVYENDFVTNRSLFCGLTIVTDDRVIDASGRSEGFIHLSTCTDFATGQRFFDALRSERIPWIKPTIDNVADTQNIKIWEIRKKGKQKVNILIENERYHIVLTRYKKVFNLTTAYYVDQNHSLRKLLKEHSSAGAFVC